MVVRAALFLQCRSPVEVPVNSCSKRSSYISKTTSLNPEKGDLRRRLDRTLGRWPGMAERDRHGKFRPCQLHRRACGNKEAEECRALRKSANVTLRAGLRYKLFRTVCGICPAEKGHIRKMLNYETSGR